MYGPHRGRARNHFYPSYLWYEPYPVDVVLLANKLLRRMH